jgi:large subunit ribosomal protein L21
MKYAIIETGGKQYRVQPGETIIVESLAVEVGSTIELDRVLMLGGDDVTLGNPTVTGARVVADVVEHGRGPKVIVLKYKRKNRYQRKMGHRQGYTRLAIKDVLTESETTTSRVGRKARGS